MTNLNRLIGTDLLIQGFSEFVRYWYSELERNQEIPETLIDSTKRYNPPIQVPESVQLIYDLIDQGYHIAPGFSHMKIVLVETNNEELEKLVKFGNRGRMGVFQTGDTKFKWYYYRNDWHAIDPNAAQSYLVESCLEAMSKFRRTLLYEGDDEKETPDEVSEMLNNSSMLFSNQDRTIGLKNSQTEFHWHENGYLITTIRTSGSRNQLQCRITFTNESQCYELNKLPNWNMPVAIRQYHNRRPYIDID